MEEKVICKVGDVNPFNHGGGVVVEDDEGLWLYWWRGREETEEGHENSEFMVYIVEIPDDPDEEYDWAVDEWFLSFIGEEEGERDMSTIGRAQRLLDLAHYYGWHNLNPWEKQISGARLMKRFGY